MDGVRGARLPPLVALVGLTGVGKSTAMRALAAAAPGALALPDRRELADRIVIPEAQRLAGEAPRPVRDRLERFRLTARYRDQNPGGLAHALQRYLLAAELPPADLLLFDNLRGESEVRFAVDAFPGCRFVVLEAAPDVRVLRLAGRRDAFDRVAEPPNGGPQGTAGGAAPARGDVVDRVRKPPSGGPQGAGPGASAGAHAEPLVRRLRTVPGLADLTDLRALAAAALDLEPEAVITGARVVAEESRNYDPAAAWGCLAALPRRRRIRLDTGGLSPAEVADRIRSWL